MIVPLVQVTLSTWKREDHAPLLYRDSTEVVYGANPRFANPLALTFHPKDEATLDLYFTIYSPGEDQVCRSSNCLSRTSHLPLSGKSPLRSH